MFIFPVIVILLSCAAGFFFWKRFRRRAISDSLNRTLFLIRLPRRSREGADIKKEINLSEQFLNSLASFKAPIIFEVAVPYVGEEIHFYASLPIRSSEPFLRQIQSVWNDAIVEKADDYNIFNYAGFSTGAYLAQKEKFPLPVRTYEDSGADTFSPILGGFTKVNEVGEGAAVQYVVKSAGSGVKKIVKETIAGLKKGKSLKSALRPESVTLSDVRKAMSGEDKNKLEEKGTRVDEAALKAVESKISKPLFEINARILSSAPSQYQADAIFEGIAAGFSQFEAPEKNGFKLVQPKNKEKLFQEFSFRTFSKGEAMVLNSEELASIFHFPTAFTEAPRVKYAKTREAPPPSNLPGSGVFVGRSVYRGEARDVRVSDDDRRRHIYVIGQTGTGKSSLLTTMAMRDIADGKGVAIIDPHGDFTEDILGLVPESRRDDVIVFDPGDLKRPLGLNMLEYDLSKPEQKTFIVNELFNILDKLYDMKTVGGPMFEQYTKNAILLLMEDMTNEPATLMEIPRVFTDPAFREKKLSRIANPVVIDFWTKEATKASGEHSLANMAPYITSKFNNFSANDYVRPIIGQTHSAFRFREIMDQGKILLLNLSKGKIGDVNANLLGMIIVGKLLMAALSRVDVSQEERRDFNLYIDEFQNFTTDSIAVILSEARKYRLNLVIAHQFIAQLSEKIRDAVFGNVGSIIAMRVGPQDAEFLGKQFAPVFKEGDLMNLDNFNACVRILIQGETVPAFNIRTVRGEPGNRAWANELRELSRAKYGRPREEVEMEILKRLRE